MNKPQWISHKYFRTYEIAGRIAVIARSPFAFLRELEELFLDDGVLEFVSKWPQDTVVHKFARWVADGMFLEDTSGPYVIEYVKNEDGGTAVQRFLPVDLCLQAYGSSIEPFKVPPSDGVSIRVNHNVTAWRESNKVADACYDYFVNELRPSQDYDDLLSQIADEVFHVIFRNREVLAGLNDFVAGYVRKLTDIESESDISRLLVKRGGRVKRQSIPTWVRNAVFFRDHGRCALCGVVLSRLLDALPQEQFDHIIPLAHGGLNDVTNLQLLCQPCNRGKSDTFVRPSNQYRRWYELKD